MIYYWYRVCPNCNGQGRLIVQKNLDANKLYLHCDECEWGWRHPEDVDDPSKKFLTLCEVFESANPTYQEILDFGWGPYALNRLEE